MNPDELRQIAVLQAVDTDALTRLAAVLEERKCGSGELVFAEGDPGDSMYFIVEGCIHIEKSGQGPGAVHKTLAVLEAGDYFGEMSLMDQKPRSASAVAAGAVRVWRLSKTAFDLIQQQSSAVGLSVLFAMIRTSSERIRRLSAQLVVYDEVGKAIGEAPDLQSLLDVIVRQLASATSADWGLLLLRSQFSERLEPRVQVNLALTAAQRDALAGGQGFVETFLREPHEQLVANLDEDAAYKANPRLGFETASLLLAPIAVESQLLGVVALGGRACDHFDLNALNLVRGISRQTAQAILNARHREDQQARSRHSRQFVRF